MSVSGDQDASLSLKKSQAGDLYASGGKERTLPLDDTTHTLANFYRLFYEI